MTRRALLVVVALVLLVPAPAAAASIPGLGPDTTVNPCDPRSGVAGMLGPAGTPGGGYARYGTCGYALYDELGWTDEGQLSSMIAGWLLDATVLVTAAANALVGWVFTDDALILAASAAGTLARGLGHDWARHLLVVALILTGVWLLIHRREAADATGAALGAVAAAAGLFVLLADPGAVIRAVAGFQADAGRAVLATAARVDGEDGDHVARAQDRIWQVYVAHPYRVVQTGSTETPEWAIRGLLEPRVFLPHERSALTDPEERDRIVQAKGERLQATRDRIEERLPAAWAYVRGDATGEQVKAAGLALLSALAAALMIVVVAGFIVVFKLLLALILIGAVIVLALSVHPSVRRGFGRRYATLGAYVFAVPLVMTMAFAVAVSFLGRLLERAASTDAGWYAASATGTALMVAALVFHKRLTALASGDVGQATRPVRPVGWGAAKHAAGVVAGGVAGGAVVAAADDEDEDEDRELPAGERRELSAGDRRVLPDPDSDGEVPATVSGVATPTATATTSPAPPTRFGPYPPPDPPPVDDEVGGARVPATRPGPVTPTVVGRPRVAPVPVPYSPPPDLPEPQGDALPIAPREGRVQPVEPVTPPRHPGPDPGLPRWSPPPGPPAPPDLPDDAPPPSSEGRHDRPVAPTPPGEDNPR